MKKSPVLAVLTVLTLMVGCNSNTPSESFSDNSESSAFYSSPLIVSPDHSVSFTGGSLSVISDNIDNLSGGFLNNPDSGSVSSSESGSSSSYVSSSSCNDTLTSKETENPVIIQRKKYTKDTRISDVINDPVFGNYGRLIFPADDGYFSGETLGDLRMTWYNNISPDKTVEIVNYMRDRAESGNVIFYDIYTESEKAADPWKNNTGLFFFKGDPGAKFAVCSAGGGFAYVGAMQDSFPHALELSKKGYNAFAVIYRPGSQTACEDLSRAIAFIFDHAEELEVDTDCYSLWGGSAGARMSAWVGSYGTESFGERRLPRAGAVIMQYTGLNEYSADDPPTYVCVGSNDGIANWRAMKDRLDGMSALGIDTEFHVYEGLRHGFGIGIGTAAEGWVNDAVKFWEKQF